MKNAVEKSQQECTLIHAESLVVALKQAVEFDDVKNAVVKFVTDIDGYTKSVDNPSVLGDMDFANLFAESIKRRNKPPRIGLMLAGHAIEDIVGKIQ